MSDKTEFANVVPSMIQDKAADWLLGKLDDELAALRELALSGADVNEVITGMLGRAEFRAKLTKATFTTQYADKE